MFDFAIFVPTPAAAGLATTIAAGSAIVGLADSVTSEVITIYYEGNINDATNVKTYADRARQAANRLATQYPTIACRTIPRNTLYLVGWFNQEEGITLIENTHIKEVLAWWLQVEKIEEKELHFSE